MSTSRATVWRKARRERGLCAVAACHEHTGEQSYRCERHAALHRDHMKAVYDAFVTRRDAELVAAVFEGRAGP